MSDFQKDLHRAICKAMHETIENYEGNDCLYKEIQNYWKQAGEGMRLGFCFCPDNESLKEIISEELTNE